MSLTRLLLFLGITPEPLASSRRAQFQPKQPDFQIIPLVLTLEWILESGALLPRSPSQEDDRDARDERPDVMG